MRFLVDAQLPRRLALRFEEAGHDAIHTLDLPKGNRTTDDELLEIAAREERVIVTKDADFVDTFLLTQEPERLLLISTGNISNVELEALLVPRIPAIIAAFEACSFVELARSALILHV